MEARRIIGENKATTPGANKTEKSRMLMLKFRMHQQVLCDALAGNYPWSIESGVFCRQVRLFLELAPLFPLGSGARPTKGNGEGGVIRWTIIGIR